MSRRKQSNPKPLKRKLEDYETEELAEQLRLPKELLSLAECSDSDDGEYAIQTNRKLRQGLVFGPYKAQIKYNKKGQVYAGKNETTLQTRDATGRTLTFLLSEEKGHWLKLTKSANDEETANFCIYSHENEIWCRIEKDVDCDSKLRSIYLGEKSPDVKTVRSSPSSSSSSSSSGRVLVNGDASIINPIVLKKEVPSDEESRSVGKVPNNNNNNNPSPKTPPNGILPWKVKQERQSPEPTTTNNRSETRASSPHEEPTNQNSYGEIFPGAFPYGFPASAPSGNFIYVNYLHGPRTSPRPSSVSSVSSDQNETRVLKTGFQCSPCGITFSSLRTLEAHQSFYCAHRENLSNTPPQHKSTSRSEDDPSAKKDSTERRTTSRLQSNNHHSTSRCKRRSASNDDKSPKVASEDSAADDSRFQGEASSSSVEVKSAKLSRSYPCPHCDYVTDRKGGLTRHMRMHDGPRTSNCAQSPSSEVPASPESHRALSRYCTNCDIQFSSHKTYHVHKTYYCNTRHVHKAAPSPAPGPSHPTDDREEDGQQQSEDKIVPTQQQHQRGTNLDPKSGLVFGHPFYAAISTSPLILVPCSYLPGGGITPSGGIVVPNGSNPEEGLSLSPVPAFAVMSNAPGTSENSGIATPKVRPLTPKSETDVKVGDSPSSESTGGCGGGGDKPLDLSVKKKTQETIKPKLEVKPITVLPSQLVNNSRAVAPDQVGSGSVLVKQGTSKCKECNIVFYKHDNYLVHKRLYCASRQNRNKRSSASSPEEIVPPSSSSPHSKQKTVNSSPARSSTSGSSPGHSPGSAKNSTSPPPPPVFNPSSTNNNNNNQTGAVYQFYCIACGIKFTSLDNLKAHRTYYCPKREALLGNQLVGIVPFSSPPMGVRGNELRCSKCKGFFPTEETLRCHPCGSQRKCPYCDVYCPTLSAAQRHLVTHTGVKAFRCTICGYKGHTLRGMRTHIRIHLDQHSNTPEENYIVCVGEDGVAVGNSLRKRAGSPGRDDSDSKSRDSSHGTPNPSDDSTNDASGAAVLGGTDSQHWCQHCGYTSSYKGNVVRHVKLVHRDLLPSPPPPASASQPPSSNRGTSPSRRTSPTGGGHLPPIFDPSGDSPEKSSSPGAPNITDSEMSSDTPENIQSIHSGGRSSCKEEPGGSENESNAKNNPRKTGPKYCKSCDISFKHLSNFVAHKKYYCTPQTADSTQIESAELV